MKVSALAIAVASALGLDSANTVKVKAAIDVALAADKAKDKAKDEGGLGPVEIQKGKDKAKDEFPSKEKAEDKDDEDKAEDKDEDEDDKAKDADKDDMSDDEDMDAEDDEQPAKTASGNSGNGGKEPTKDAKAMDAKIKLAIDARDALHAARRAVEPVLGEVTYDSAAEVYGAALKKLGVDTAGVHASAFPTMYKLAVEKLDARTPVIASDSATVKTMAGAIKGYDRR